MSNNSSNSFAPYKYSGNSNGTFRKAGDYLQDFTKKSGSNLGNILGYKDENSSNSDLRGGVQNSNVSKVLSGDGTNTSFKTNKESTTPAKASTTPAKTVSAQPAATPAGGIDYAAWAKESVANDPTSAAAGADAAYWEKTYRRNNAEYEQNKALMASHQGPKTWDELAARDQSRQGDVVSRNTGSIEDYESYTKYATAQQGVKQWEESSSKWRT